MPIPSRQLLHPRRNRSVHMRTSRTRPSERSAVPAGLQIAGSYAWRLLAIAAVAGVLVWLVIQFKILVVPLLVAILITALVWPFFTWLQRRGVPKWIAIATTVLGTLAVITALIWLVSWQISAQWSDVTTKASETVQGFRQFLIDGPLHLSTAQIDQLLDDGIAQLQEQAGALINGVLAFGSTLGHVAAGALLALFALLCLLADGPRIWSWTTRLFPRRARHAVDQAGRNGWQTLINYAKTQITVATIDAVGIGAGAFLLGVPLAIPIAVTVFLGSFVPVVGAIVTGALAVLIALLYNGLWVAVAMLAVVLIVQQVEGHVLQPLIMGAAVNVHPLAVIMAVAGGSMLAGIPGALFAVPIVAFINVAAVTIASGSWRTGTPPDSDALIWSTRPLPETRSAR
ncbi:AI-2E family transporter [Microbacterium sp. CH-015]|uniref:AI-2E family transporter n=1 Tax=Microbacterium sp. CH-015 TaxID=3406734 RepID=UPI003C732370